MDGQDDKGDQASALAESNASLQTRLAQEQGNRREERFLWIICTLVLLDVLVLGNLENATVPLVVLALEILALAILARRLGINNTAAIVDRFSSILASEVKPKADGK